LIEIRDDFPITVFKRFECRAGSQQPNKNNSWSGDLESKNSIHIKSLNHDFLESVLMYCKTQPDLAAGYNQDLEDCRCVVSVSCIQNKKGIAAKKTLIEKFFIPKKEDAPDIKEDSKELSNIKFLTPILKPTGEKISVEGQTIETSKPCPYFEGIKRGSTFKFYRACVALTEDLPKEYLGNDSKAEAKMCADKCINGCNLNSCRFYNLRQSFEGMTCKECNLFGEQNWFMQSENIHTCKRIHKNGKTGNTLPTIRACEHFVKRLEIMSKANNNTFEILKNIISMQRHS
jgi:hypothetical protein